MEVLLVIDGVVDNCILADSLEAASLVFPDAHCVERTEGMPAGPGWLYDGSTFTAPPVAVQPPEPISKIAFLQRTTSAQRIAIRDKAVRGSPGYDAIVGDFVYILDATDTIDLTHDDTIAGVNYLVSLGLLSAGDAERISDASLGGQTLRQHVVEFVPGTGTITDGVVDATSTSGPWTFTPPAFSMNFIVDACGAGGGGGGGYGSTASRAGGGAGASGLQVANVPIHLVPNASLTIAAGAAGTAGAAGSAGGAGGATLIAGGLGTGLDATTIGRIRVAGGGGGSAASSSGSGAGGTINNSTGNGSTVGNGASAAAGGSGSILSGIAGTAAALGAPFLGGWAYGWGGASGGNASTTGSTAGGAGGPTIGGGNILNTTLGANVPTPATGSTDATNSYGGGGTGSWSFFGLATSGGNGNTAAAAGTGFGYGGAGGGGNASGAAGGAGYVRITYWSMD